MKRLAKHYIVKLALLAENRRYIYKYLVITNIFNRIDHHAGADGD